jgi:hypothetical protein
MDKERLTNLKQTLKRNKEFTTLDVIEQLEQQIEKMKCCYLCKSVYNCAFADVFNFHCCDNWELAE